MLATGAILKSLYLKLFLVTHVTYLWHYCAIKVKAHFEDVDQITAIAISTTVEYKTRKAKFSSVGCPPQPVVTGWESWLNTALNYYSKNLLK